METKKTQAWLSYAWKDNQEQQVDWIVQELEREPQRLEVHLDNRDIIPGQRLWDQIGKAISDPDICDAWIFVVTPNSLGSEPCREELAYALDRALSVRGQNFPLIGLIDGKFNSKDLPSSLKVRLCVSTWETHWRQRVASGVRGIKPGSLPGDDLHPIIFNLHDSKAHKKGVVCVEIRPRVGAWRPFVAGVPKLENEKLVEVIPGARGSIPTGYMVSSFSGESENGQLFIRGMDNEVSPTTSAYIFLNDLPSALFVGENGGTLYDLIQIIKEQAALAIAQMQLTNKK